MLNICICDNHEEDLQKIHDLTKDIMDRRDESYRIITFNSLRTLEDTIHYQTFCYDICILDIIFEQIDSFDIVKKINQTYPNCQIIYLSQCLQTARKISGTRFAYYLYKEDLDEKFKFAIEFSIENIHHYPSFLVKQGKQTIILKQSDIIFFERDLRITKIHTINGTYTIPTKIADCYKQLDNRFILVHRSFIVNAHHVKEFNLHKILLDGGHTVSISRQYKTKTREFFNNFFLEQVSHHS